MRQEPKAAAATAVPEAAAVANGAPAAEEAAEQDPYAFLPKPADNNKVCTWRSHHAFNAMYPLRATLQPPAATEVWKQPHVTCMVVSAHGCFPGNTRACCARCTRR